MPEFEDYKPGSNLPHELLKRDIIVEEYPDIPFLFMDPPDYDEAIIGVAEEFGGRLTVAYDFDKVIEINMKLTQSDYEGAVEYFEYNQIGSYVGEYTPVFVHK